MDELIERLNDAWRKLYGDGDEHDVCDTLAEAAAALEAAREDANLVYRMIPTLPVTPETCEQATDALTQFCLSFHAAIDHTAAQENDDA